MIREIQTPNRVDASIHVSGSKSITNRALVCAALARGVSTIGNASDSDDTARMLNGLNQFGVLARISGDVVHVEGTGGRLFAPRYPIPVGNAGTTLRFLCSVAALAEGRTEFQLGPRMAERPMDVLLEALRALGVGVEWGGGKTGLAVTGGGLHGGLVALRATESSQFLSSLLLIAPYADGGLCVTPQGGVSSRPYVEMTLEVMKQFGVDVVLESGSGGYRVDGVGRYRPAEIAVEADVSAASCFFAAAAVTGGSVEVRGIRRPSLQGDIGFLDVLGRMGCTIEETSEGVRVRRGEPLRRIDIDMNGMPDIVPALGVTALFADGASRLRNIAQLRHKESDRLLAIATELRKTGAEVTLHRDGLEIQPGPLHGALLETYDDHRLAMSFALIGLSVPGIAVENPLCVRKSFPGFWAQFEKLEEKR